MKTQCPHCSHLFEVPDESINKQVSCAKCGKTFDAVSYLDEVIKNLPKELHESSDFPSIELSGSNIRFCGTFLVVCGIICGILLNAMAGLIAFIGGAIIIALGCILKKLELILSNIEKYHITQKSNK